MYFYSEWLLVFTYSQLIFKLLKVINDATSFSFKAKQSSWKNFQSLYNAFWNALCHLLGHRSFSFLPHTCITWWIGFTTASLLSRETPELAKTNYHQKKKKKRCTLKSYIPPEALQPWQEFLYWTEIHILICFTWLWWLKQSLWVQKIGSIFSSK